MIVATDLKNGIGLNNSIPWHFSKDMKYFKEKTIGNKNNAVVMGYNTYTSIGKPLANRVNIILSRKKIISDSLLKSDTIVLSNPENIFKMDSFDEIWIIGGGEIYKYFLSKSHLLDEIYVTKVNNSYNCDTFFPKVPDTFYINDSNVIIDINKKNNQTGSLEFIVYKSK